MANLVKNKIFGICIAAILDISEKFDINPDELYGPGQGMPASDLRHVLIYTMIIDLGLNRKMVMDLFGRERSTSYNSIEKVRNLLSNKDAQITAFHRVSYETFHLYFSLN